MEAIKTKEAIVLQVPLLMKAVGQAKGDTKRKEINQKKDCMADHLHQSTAQK